MRRGLAIWSVFLTLMIIGTFSAPIALAAVENEIQHSRSSNEVMVIVFSVALVVGVSCLGAGYAVARVGAAALGAASERPELLGRSLILVGLAEGIAIYGLIVGIMLMRLL